MAPLVARTLATLALSTAHHHAGTISQVSALQVGTVIRHGRGQPVTRHDKKVVTTIARNVEDVEADEEDGEEPANKFQKMLQNSEAAQAAEAEETASVETDTADQASVEDADSVEGSETAVTEADSEADSAIAETDSEADSAEEQTNEGDQQTTEEDEDSGTNTEASSTSETEESVNSEDAVLLKSAVDATGDDSTYTAEFYHAANKQCHGNEDDLKVDGHKVEYKKLEDAKAACAENRLTGKLRINGSNQNTNTNKNNNKPKEVTKKAKGSDGKDVGYCESVSKDGNWFKLTRRLCKVSWSKESQSGLCSKGSNCNGGLCDSTWQASYAALTGDVGKYCNDGAGTWLMKPNTAKKVAKGAAADDSGPLLVDFADLSDSKAVDLSTKGFELTAKILVASGAETGKVFIAGKLNKPGFWKKTSIRSNNPANRNWPLWYENNDNGHNNDDKREKYLKKAKRQIPDYIWFDAATDGESGQAKALYLDSGKVCFAIGDKKKMCSKGKFDDGKTHTVGVNRSSNGAYNIVVDTKEVELDTGMWAGTSFTAVDNKWTVFASNACSGSEDTCGGTNGYMGEQSTVVQITNDNGDSSVKFGKFTNKASKIWDVKYKAANSKNARSIIQNTISVVTVDESRGHKVYPFKREHSWSHASKVDNTSLKRLNTAERDGTIIDFSRRNFEISAVIDRGNDSDFTGTGNDSDFKDNKGKVALILGKISAAGWQDGHGDSQAKALFVGSSKYKGAGKLCFEMGWSGPPGCSTKTINQLCGKKKCRVGVRNKVNGSTDMYQLLVENSSGKMVEVKQTKMPKRPSERADTYSHRESHKEAIFMAAQDVYRQDNANNGNNKRDGKDLSEPKFTVTDIRYKRDYTNEKNEGFQVVILNKKGATETDCTPMPKMPCAGKLKSNCQDLSAQLTSKYSASLPDPGCTHKVVDGHVVHTCVVIEGYDFDYNKLATAQLEKYQYCKKRQLAELKDIID